MTSESIQLPPVTPKSTGSNDAPTEPESKLDRISTHHQTEVYDALQDETVVGSVDAHGGLEENVPKTSFVSQFTDPIIPSADAETSNVYPNRGEKDTEVVADPLRSFSNLGSDAQELTVVVEESDMTDKSGGSNLQPVSEKQPSSATPRRGSHLHLNLKTPSPQPWEIFHPPDSHDIKGVSTMTPRKLHKLQNATDTNPLIPKSSYYFGPPPEDSAFGTPPVGQIGVHHPREIIRIERDYTGGELVQFAPIFPLELDGRISPTHFLESINAINELLISAHSLRHTFWDNTVAILTLQISRLFLTSHYEKEMFRLQVLIDTLNAEVYNPVGLNILWPRNVAFLFLEIEYYVSLNFSCLQRVSSWAHLPIELHALVKLL